MLLSSHTDFNYDDQTSSNSPGPPAGDGSPGRGYREVISGAVAGVAGFIGGLTGGIGDSYGSGGNDSEWRNHNERWDSERRNHNERRDSEWRNHNERRDGEWRNRNERRDDNWGRDTLRDKLRNIANTTLLILDDGEYFPPGQDGPYDLNEKVLWSDENTRYYGPDAGEGGEILESEFIRINEEGGDEGKEEERNKDRTGEKANDASDPNENQGKKESKKTTSSAASKPHRDDDDNTNPKDQTRVQATVPPVSPKKATLDDNQTTIYIGEYSTLIGARKVYLALARNADPFANNKIGVLNFASAKKPGGGFINGSQAQEESLARASTLYSSLMTDTASQFYTHHREDPDNAYYTHAMVYSPGIVLIRDDDGEWRSPVEVDVLTSAAVNAGEIRRGLERAERLRREKVEKEYWKRKEEERLRKQREDFENWKKKGEKRKKEIEKAMAETRRLKEEAKNKKEKEGMAKLKKQGSLVKLQKEMVEIKKTDKGKARDSGSEKEESLVEQEKAIAEVENENEKGKEAEKPEENDEHVIDSPESGLGSDSDSQLKGAEEITESKGSPIQDDRPQPETLPEVNQGPTSSSTLLHPLSPPTQRSQVTDPDPHLTYALALENAENQIQQTMYDRISRILHLFQLHQTPHLILGSFGTGVFKNRIELIATIFADLLIKPSGRFKGVFQTVVFAILGKETVRVFTHVFRKFDKRAQRERLCKTCVFEDSFGKSGSDGDVKEGDEEKTMRMMKWKEKRRKRYSLMHGIPDAAADTASLDPSQVDAAYNPLYFDAVQDNAVSYPTSFAATAVTSCAPPFDAAQSDVVAHATSSNAAQANVASCPPSFDATHASANLSPTVITDADYSKIPEDAKMILTRGDGQVDFVAEPIATLNAMAVDDGKDTEMIGTRSLPSLPTRSHEAQDSRSNKKEDSDIEMQ